MISFDVKPGNILLDKTMTIAKLSDMGLAKLLTRSQTMTMMVRPPLCKGLKMGVPVYFWQLQTA